jgi:arylsulfatase A-like enzyme
MLVSWPAVIKAGSQNHEVSAFWDWLPTFAEIVGEPLPPDDQIDGISLVSTLKGDSDKQRHHDYLYWEFMEGRPRKAVRCGKWKAIWIYNKDGKTIWKTELFDLSKTLRKRCEPNGFLSETKRKLGRLFIEEAIRVAWVVVGNMRIPTR